MMIEGVFITRDGRAAGVSGSDSAKLCRWRCHHTVNKTVEEDTVLTLSVTLPRRIYLSPQSPLCPRRPLLSPLCRVLLALSIHLVFHLFIASLFPLRFHSLWWEMRLLLHWGKLEQMFGNATIAIQMVMAYCKAYSWHTHRDLEVSALRTLYHRKAKHLIERLCRKAISVKSLTLIHSFSCALFTHQI